jgi:hypothetical protein
LGAWTTRSRPARLPRLELLQLAGREVVAVGKDQAVLLGQQGAGLAEESTRTAVWSFSLKMK